VIAVAVYGLYGAATNKWDISLKIEAHGAFDAFWETMAFIVNGIIFFYSGVACINFIVRYVLTDPAGCLVNSVECWGPVDMF
jgi:NhaP-type Na+/H+ or K+/H+ antiporter